MSREQWTKKASKLLLGKRITKVEYMPGGEAVEADWNSCPILIGLEDGSWLIPQSDDEGNDGGVIAVSSKGGYEVLPVLGVNHK